jgi:hypothetical protein
MRAGSAAHSRTRRLGRERWWRLGFPVRKNRLQSTCSDLVLWWPGRQVVLQAGGGYHRVMKLGGVFRRVRLRSALGACGCVQGGGVR